MIFTKEPKGELIQQNSIKLATILPNSEHHELKFEISAIISSIEENLSLVF